MHFADACHRSTPARLVGDVEQHKLTADRCGNSNSASQVLTVVDDSPPVFGPLPTDTLVSCADVTPPDEVAVSDDCDPAPELVFNEVREDGDCEDNYSLTRTWKNRLSAVSDPWNTSLQALTKQHYRSANDWNKFWNKHKSANWDKPLKKTR